MFTVEELLFLKKVWPFLTSLPTSMTSNKWPYVYKNLPKNDFTRKITDFDTFTKIALECGRFGQTNCCHTLWKVAQSPINSPIWSHCFLPNEGSGGGKNDDSENLESCKKYFCPKNLGNGLQKFVTLTWTILYLLLFCEENCSRILNWNRPASKHFAQ